MDEKIIINQEPFQAGTLAEMGTVGPQKFQPPPLLARLLAPPLQKQSRSRLWEIVQAVVWAKTPTILANPLRNWAGEVAGTIHQLGSRVDKDSQLW